MLLNKFFLATILALYIVTSFSSSIYAIVGLDYQYCTFKYNCTVKNCSDFKFEECKYKICNEPESQSEKCQNIKP